MARAYNREVAEESIKSIKAKNWPLETRQIYYETLFCREDATADELAHYRLPDLACVYVIEANGQTKIGFSKEPARRVRDLEAGQAHQACVFWALEMSKANARLVERRLHQALKGSRHHIRGEWYLFAPQTAVALIKREVKKLDIKTQSHPMYSVLRGADVETAGGSA